MVPKVGLMIFLPLQFLSLFLRVLSREFYSNSHEADRHTYRERRGGKGGRNAPLLSYASVGCCKDATIKSTKMKLLDNQVLGPNL